MSDGAKTGTPIMSLDEFSEIWKGSGLQTYYERMDDLQRLGMTFGPDGDMDHDQSEAFNLILGDKPIAELDQEAIPALCAAALRVSIRLKSKDADLTEALKVAGELAEAGEFLRQDLDIELSDRGKDSEKRCSVMEFRKALAALERIKSNKH